MILPLVAIEDVFTGFGTPRAVTNIDSAKRDFRLLEQNDPRHGDLRLYHLGEFDTETGEIKSKKPEILMKGEPKYENQNTLDRQTKAT